MIRDVVTIGFLRSVYFIPTLGFGRGGLAEEQPESYQPRAVGVEDGLLKQVSGTSEYRKSRTEASEYRPVSRRR